MLFLVKYMQRVVFIYDQQQVQEMQDITETPSRASRTVPGGQCHRDFSTP